MSKARELANLGNAYSDGALSNRNLIINGAMQVAQRGTSATGTSYRTVDRFYLGGSASASTITQEQSALSSSDTPYSEGFRYSFKITNNTATNNSNDYVEPTYVLENQDLAQSGWDATSSSSYATLSFWVKSSLAGTYYLRFLCTEGSSSGWKSYIEPFTLSSNTWKKVTVTLTGGTQSFPVTNEGDVRLNINAFYGTDFTSSSATTGSWHTFSSSAEYPDFVQNWKNTAGATFEFTGVQLEAGDTATPFEHRSFGQELALCQRYFCKTYNYETALGTATRVGSLFNSVDATQSYAFTGQFNYPVSMRAIPTIVVYNPNNGTAGQLAADSNNLTATINTDSTGSDRCAIGVSNISIGTSAYVRAHATASAEL